MKKISAATTILALAFGVSLPAQATVVTLNPFDGSSYEQTFSKNGLTFTINEGHSGGFEIDKLGKNYFYGSYGNPLTVSKVGGGIFYLNSFDSEEVNVFTGEIDGTFGLQSIMTYTDVFGSHEFSYTSQKGPTIVDVGAFMTSFSIFPRITNDEIVLGYQAETIYWNLINNIVYDERLAASAIPEPGSLALLGLGLAGLYPTRRRKIN